MNVRKIGCALALVAVFAVSAQEPPAGNLTWQEANKRSAALVREKGATSEAADLAKMAFDLYPQQTKRYDPLNHAQLLLNLLDVRHQADGNKAALREVDAGAAAITQKTGSPNGVLVAVWQEAARIAGRGTARAGAYNDRALALAEQVLGRDHPDTIDLLLDVVFDWRKDRGDAWALARLAEARERAIMAGEDSRQMTQVDLQLAKLHLEQGKGALAIETYRSVIDRLEKRADPAQESYLQMAYAQLEYAYEENGEDELAAEMHQRRLDRLSRDATNPMPTLRIPPQYPATAARDGR
jgi:tetratricopeptide (TPR) repeat protein